MTRKTQTTATVSTVDYLPLWRAALSAEKAPTFAQVQAAGTSVTDANVLSAIRLTRSVDETAEGKPGRYATLHPSLVLSTVQAQYSVGSMCVRVGETITLAQGRAAYALTSHPATRSAKARKAAFDAVLGADSDGLTGQPFGRLMVETYATVVAAAKQAAADRAAQGEGSGDGSGEGTAPSSTRTDADRIKAALDALKPVIGRVQDGSIDDDGWTAFARMVTDLAAIARKARATRTVAAPQPAQAEQAEQEDAA